MLEKVKNIKSNSKLTKAPNKAATASVKTGHPDHSANLVRLRRIKGQIEGIENMILDHRYCPDIIAQVKAARSALSSVEAEIFKSHLRGCVKSAMSTKDAFTAEEKIQEIIKMMF